MKKYFGVLFFVFIICVFTIFNFNCKTLAKYNITGNWTATITYSDSTSDIYYFTFTGDSESGTVTHTAIQYPGTYEVNGSNVSFSFEYIILYTKTIETYTGSFDSENQMSGNFEWNTYLIAKNTPPLVWEWGTWTATRQ